MPVTHKWVLRLYQEEGMAMRKRWRRQGVAVVREPLELPSAPNEVLSMDFVMDALADGRRLKVLIIIDDITKESVVFCGCTLHSRRLCGTGAGAGSTVPGLAHGHPFRPVLVFADVAIV